MEFETYLHMTWMYGSIILTLNLFTKIWTFAIELYPSKLLPSVWPQILLSSKVLKQTKRIDLSTKETYLVHFIASSCGTSKIVRIYSDANLSMESTMLIYLVNLEWSKTCKCILPLMTLYLLIIQTMTSEYLIKTDTSSALKTRNTCSLSKR